MSRQTDTGAGKQSDTLLWVGAVVVLGVAAGWLALAKPWASDPASAAPIGMPLSDGANESAQPETGGASRNAGVDDPLRLARLAYDAGMLIEPADYSAWSLYARELERDPGNTAAAEGLERVADDLLARGDVALEQGRYDDAEALIERVLSVFPAHEGAAQLADAVEARIRESDEASEPTPEQEPPPAETQAAAAEEPPAPEEEPPDPMELLQERFDAAMEANRLLAPAGESAHDIVAGMLELDSGHAFSEEARHALFDRLLTRATEAVETLDTQAANTWIDAAEELAVDAQAVASARQALTARLAAMEAARPIPVSEFTVVEYTPPEYPSRALDLGVEGWVDVEFVVAADGATRDITVTEASHERYFQAEAADAVQEWRFEPRRFMGQTLEQRTYTRINFTLQD